MSPTGAGLAPTRLEGRLLSMRAFLDILGPRTCVRWKVFRATWRRTAQYVAALTDYLPGNLVQ